jgi:hypothetical protein
MHARTPDALVQAWEALRVRTPDRALTRKFAETLGWQPMVAAQCALYERVLAAGHGHVVAGATR